MHTQQHSVRRLQVKRQLRRSEIIEYIRRRRDYFGAHYHVKKIALIGSFARGEQQAHSDIDVLVDLEAGTPDISEVKRALRQELEERFGRRVEIASERWLKPYYREEILRDAIYV